MVDQWYCPNCGPIEREHVINRGGCYGGVVCAFCREFVSSKPPLKKPPADSELTGTTNFLHDFWQLRSSQRRRIMADLGLLNEIDMKKREDKRYGDAILKAKECGLLDQVIAKVREYTPADSGEGK